MWRITALSLEEYDAVSARFERDGRHIEVVAILSLQDRMATLSGCHLQGDGANTLNVSALRALARWAKEYFDVDQLRIIGAARTSGAGPGRTPRPLVF